MRSDYAALVRTDRGARLMDEIRSSAAGTAEVERARLELRRSELERSNRNTRRTIVALGSLLGLAGCSDLHSSRRHRDQESQYHVTN